MDALSVLFLAALSDLSSDAAFYRVSQPARHLAERPDGRSVHVTSNLDPNIDALIEAADVIILHELADPDLFPKVTAARERGSLVIYDLAHDITSLPTLHPLQSYWVEEQAQRHAFKLAKLATMFTASNVRLLSHWAAINPRGNLVANAWPFEVHATREPSPRFHIAMVVDLHEYAGARDVIGSLLAWMSVTKHATLEVLAPELVHQAFARGPADRMVLSTAREQSDRLAAFRRADVALLALENSNNAMRLADVRWLEAAASGAVVLAPNLGAYAERITPGANGILYNEADEAIPALDRLSTDPDLLAHVRATAALQVTDERQLRASLDEQVAYWRKFVKRAPDASRAELPPRLPGTTLPHEHELFEGLLYAGPLNDRAIARKHFERAAELLPTSPEPYLLLARVVPNPIEVVLKAVQLAPKSLRANLLLGDALSDAGQHQDALAIYQRTAEFYPAWELPYLRVAMLLEGMGMKAESEQFVHMAAGVATFLEEAIEARG